MGPSIIKRLYERLFQISFFDLITICVYIVLGSLVVTKIGHKTAAYSYIKQIASETIRPQLAKRQKCQRRVKLNIVIRQTVVREAFPLSHCRSADKAILLLQLCEPHRSYRFVGK